MCPPQPSVPHLYVALMRISYHCARLLLFECPEKLIAALYPHPPSAPAIPTTVQRQKLRTLGARPAVRGGAWTR